MHYRDLVLKYYREHRADGHRPDIALGIAKYDAKYKQGKKLDIMPSRYDAYEGEKITKLPNCWKIKVEFQYDMDSGPPWEQCEDHGVVGKWERGRREYDDDWLLMSDCGSYLYYNWKAGLKLAIKDGWGPRSPMDAVKADYEYLRRWCDNKWWYVGMIVTLYDVDGNTILAKESCWGYESDNIVYLCSEARSWAAYMIRKERKDRRTAALAEKIGNRFADAMECGV